MSLFAAPEAGYRFADWGGACKNSLGPLCVLKMDKDRTVTARFIKDSRTHSKVKALLLLHGMNANHETWNEFVKQRFGDRCTRIYGGVAIGTEAKSVRNNVYCYRMDFGYYDNLSGRKGLEGLTPAGVRAKGQLAAGDFSTFQQLGYEVRAAVRAILDRHPKAGIVLFGHSRGGLAARTLLQSNALERRASEKSLKG